MPSRASSEDSKILGRAKRTFLLNAGLVALIAISLLTQHFLSKDSELAEAEQSNNEGANIQFDLIETIRLRGQAHGLAEDPRITYPLSSEQLTSKALQVIATFPGERLNIEELTTEYIKGYQSYFEEYYADHDGYQAGYNYGLRIDPTLYAPPTSKNLTGLLIMNKRRACEKFQLNEVQWIVFQEGFLKGFSIGYERTEDGVTEKVNISSSIFDD